MSEKQVLDQHLDVIHAESAQRHEASDDEPMVYVTPKDYATSARLTRDHLIANGVDPDSVIFQSELRNHIPRREKEPTADFAKRYTETINAMIQRGVSILNDQCTSETVASTFRTRGGRSFDLGPGSGATKGEFREFSKWFEEMSKTGQMHGVPEKWLKFEKLAK